MLSFGPLGDWLRYSATGCLMASRRTEAANNDGIPVRVATALGVEKNLPKSVEGRTSSVA
jgi:hypothetical protein